MNYDGPNRRKHDDLQLHIEEDQRMFDKYDRVIFGDVSSGDIGMMAKVNEMHEILVQVKGWKMLGGLVLLVAGIYAAIKTLGIFK